MQFSHLHNHTQFSLLDGASSIDKLFKKAKADNMPAVAITDHGNMFGVFDFVSTAGKYGVKPVVGCEFYVVEDHTIKSFTKDKKDKRYHQLLLAKNKQGYQNLTKLCSLGYMDGLYGKYPRITKDLIEKYKEGLIATTCCIGARVPQEILRHGEAAGEEEFKWWLERFGEDYYIEIQRHDIPDQNKVNLVLQKWAKEYNVKVIASNDSHYVDQEDWVAHDILLCVNTNEKMSTPKMKDYDDEGGSNKDTRFAFYNDQFYFKSTAEMSQLFSDMPEAIDNTNDIVGKVDTLNLKQDILLPNFPIPEEFKIHTDDKENQWEYLKHLTYEGAKARYGEINEEARERIDFELFTIKTMGFAGYFLIVMDFIKAGRELGVMIGPGRGSAAGSVVAYCIGITNIDPIKYNLLFERFLNPDRKSMPDIDTDFDDEGRQKVIDYVVGKYGRNQVAQIITYGTMATKSSIKDVARVMELPLSDANYIAKLVPDKPGYGMNFEKLIHYPENGPGKTLHSLGLSADEVENVRKVRDMYNGVGLEAKVLKQAEKLEGTVRNTGIHAAGIIIAPYDLSDIVPVSTAKDADLLVTQYEGKIIEDAGVIKMDFLGLRNLTIIKEALRMIKENHGVEIEIDNIPLDDEKTFELFQRGETNAIFQFESDGMKKYMKELKPDRFDDLIAMNALYRPGPLAYIPDFIKRKHGLQEITYDLPEMEEYLAETYGITVYQEQVMLLSQKLANFTKGDADVLRKAMGKKQIEVLNKLKAKFMEGGSSNGHEEKILEKIWKDWEAFAQYAFNKSHSTCYAFVAYQTAYLKSHYPSEYMAGVLTSQLGNIDKITFFMEECRNLGLPVLGPDVNESAKRFGVNENGEIRFGLGGIKGTGDAAVEAIIDERDSNGPYKDVYDFMTRVNLRTVNKKTLESLIYAGAFDCFEEFNRAQYFANNPQGINFIETLIRYANQMQEEKNSAQVSLFGGGGSGEADIAAPKPERVEPWGNIERLKYEKDVVGFYISGHPLDQFSIEMSLCKPLSSDLLVEANKDKEFSIGGMITSMSIRQTKTGNPFSSFKLEDYEGSMEIVLFGKDHVAFSNYLMEGQFLFIRGRVQSRWSGNDLEFKPIEMQLLSEIKEKRFKEVNLKLELKEIDEPLIAEILNVSQAFPGKFDLRFNVYDSDERLDLQLFSRKTKVDINKKVYQQLRELCGDGNVTFG